MMVVGWKLFCLVWFLPLPPTRHSLICSFGQGSSQGFYHSDGEYISRGPTFGNFVANYPHRGVDAGRHSCETTEYKGTDSPKGVGPSKTSAWSGWKQPDMSVKVDTVRLETSWFKKCCVKFVLKYHLSTEFKSAFILTR
jgi:hypothetical protein